MEELSRMPNGGTEKDELISDATEFESEEELLRDLS
jgi:hypothetical protein